MQRHHRLCEQLYIGSQYYKLEQSSEGTDLSFRKDPHQIGKAKALFGRNIIVTDNTDWSTEDIVQASLDRWGVEKAFRETKSRHHSSAHPMYHWTDSSLKNLPPCKMTYSNCRGMVLTKVGTYNN